MTPIRRHGSPAPHAANADLSRAVRIALEHHGVPCIELRSGVGGRMVVGAIEKSGRLVLCEIMGPGSPAKPSINGSNVALRQAGAIVVPIHDQTALMMLLERIRRAKG